MDAPISIDYGLAMADGVGPEGLSEAQLGTQADALRDASTRLRERVDSGELGFWNLPSDRGQLDGIRQAAGALPDGITDALILGIGGSSLGTRAIYNALITPPELAGQTRSGLRLHLPDNSDPWLLGQLLELLVPDRTAVLVISKSGGTIETAAQLLVVERWLQEALGDRTARHIIAITDPSTGTLRAEAGARGWTTLEVPSNVGGRFSVLTPVGLLPAHLAGVDVAAMLDGAAAMATRCEGDDLAHNPAGLLAAVHVAHHLDMGHGIHVLMPYADRLRALCAWFVQLWAESLGKRHNRAGERVEQGPTPLPAIGATDQHAQMQLFMEGPRDKLVSFLSIRAPDRDLTIPPSDGANGYLSGASMNGVLAAECEASMLALASDGRPSLHVQLERADAAGLGALFFLYEATTALAGELYGVNAFDQPGVEVGKRLAYAQLGRVGHEDARAELERLRAARPDRYRL